MPLEFRDPAFLPFIAHFQKLRDHAHRLHRDVIVAHPEWRQAHDARAAVLGHIVTATDAAKLAVTLAGAYLDDPYWWRRNMSPEITTPEMEIQVHAFIGFIKRSFGHSTFSAAETFFRNIARALETDYSVASQANFATVYKSLLEGPLAGTAGDGITLLDLLRHLRNTVHNNGAHYDARGRNADVTYRGIKYTFQHGQVVTFAEFPWLLQLTADLSDLIARTVANPVVTGIVARIPDSGGYYEHV